ncbi:MAG: hypothetical protein U5N55_10745 [Cypionkella sp.]|nr:hypothetical protein [Cypionkella sp.]
MQCDTCQALRAKMLQDLLRGHLLDALSTAAQGAAIMTGLKDKAEVRDDPVIRETD